MGGFRAPEMIKRRPAIVISPRLPHRDGLCTVVPLSGSEPARQVDYVVRVELAEDLPTPFAARVWWAKCDMLATVSFERLDFFRTSRDQQGKRKYLHPALPKPEMQRIFGGIMAALGLKPLTFSGS